jgi:dephospho-CoA kinase
MRPPVAGDRGRSKGVHLFGLTGGIASGKSTVAARLRSRGIPVIDADALAREVVAPGTDGLAAIVDAFGPSILVPDGSLDRKALARVAFADPIARKKLEGITHPRIGQLVMQRASQLAAAGEPLACYEAALIVENGLADAFRPLIVVACSPEVQLSRVQARDQAKVQDAMARIEAQKPTAEKVALADYVIDTGGSLEDNERQTDRALAAICAKLGVDPARYGLE